MAAAEDEVEKGCEHEGLRRDRERIALDDCLTGSIVEAMVGVTSYTRL